MHSSRSPARANFAIMMECTPESGHCNSVFTLCGFRILCTVLYTFMVNLVSQSFSISVNSKKGLISFMFYN